jgi:outer membrane protein assembly factor BamB
MALTQVNRSRFWVLAIIFFFGCFKSIAAAAEWPEFRGPTADGISTAKNVPTEWSATEHVAWKNAIPGVGWSSPVIANGRIYLTTAIGKDAEPISLRAMCIDASDGHVVWDAEVFKPETSAAHEIQS